MQQILAKKRTFIQVGFPETDPFSLKKFHLKHTHAVVAIIIEHLSIKSAPQAVGSLRMP